MYYLKQSDLCTDRVPRELTELCKQHANGGIIPCPLESFSTELTESECPLTRKCSHVRMIDWRAVLEWRR